MSSQQDQAPGSGQRPATADGQAPLSEQRPAAADGQAPLSEQRPAAADGQAPLSEQASSAGKAPDGGKLFRMTPPLVFWWAWTAVAVLSLGDLAVQGHDRAAVQPALAVVMITGLVYACALRPRVIADSGGLVVRNPLRDYRMPWGVIRGIFLADSVEFQCARPAPMKDKTIYSWALYGSRRARAKAGLRSSRWDRGAGNRPRGYARMPSEAQEVLKQAPAEVMARELSRLSEQARAAGAADGILSATWAWDSLAAVLIPAAALVLAIVFL